MAVFYSTKKSLSVGSGSAVANFHNGVCTVSDPNVIKLLRAAMKRPFFGITEKAEPIAEDVKEAVEEAVKQESSEKATDKPKKQQTSKKK